jgi:DNA-binding GntR family transcriptional regulator
MTPKRDRVARIVRARIERGDFPDGHHLVQDRLAAEYGVNRDVVWYALAALQREGLVSLVDNRYVVNASHAARQLEGVIQRLDDIERLVRSSAASGWIGKATRRTSVAGVDI